MVYVAFTREGEEQRKVATRNIINYCTVQFLSPSPKTIRTPAPSRPGGSAFPATRRSACRHHESTARRRAVTTMATATSMIRWIRRTRRRRSREDGDSGIEQSLVRHRVATTATSSSACATAVSPGEAGPVHPSVHPSVRPSYPQSSPSPCWAMRGVLRTRWNVLRSSAIL